MQELKTTRRVPTEEFTGRAVTIFFHPHFIVLTGKWHWDLASDAVFCSNVMLSLPMDFAGTRGIIHPDDVEMVRKKLQAEKGIHLEFRIITTYGEVKTIVGENVHIEESRTDVDEVQQYFYAEVAGDSFWKKQYERLAIYKEIHEKASRYTNTGIWWYNDMTNETWYSAEVYRIYDLPPNSLNPHLNTFNAFIHPEEKELVEEFFDKAYKEKAPLHIEYRIKTPGAEKHLLHITQWFFNDKGEYILSGILKDITQHKAREIDAEELHDQSFSFKQQLVFGEQNIGIGHWQVNLVTRKTLFSNNYFRLFGMKPNPLPERSMDVIEYIHPGDQETYRQAYKKMLNQYAPPELDFRIHRSDGKLRYLSQKAKLVTIGNDMVMIGIIQDVTVQKMLERKVKELGKAAAVKNFVQNQYEAGAGLAGWVWNINEGSIEGSENLYRFLGLKPGSVELTPKKLLSFVHPEDQKRFGDEISLVLQQGQETSFEFRLMQSGKTKSMRASFRAVKNEDADLFIGTLQDITKEQQLKQQLHQRVQLAEALSENIADRIIITDVNNTILVWNKPCEGAYRASKDDVLGKNFFDVFPKLKTEEELVLLSRVLKGENIFLPENKSLQGTGYYDLHLLPLWDDDKAEVTGIIHIIRDVTKEMELRQHLNERLSFIENLVESSVDRIIAIDRNLNYIVWNKKCEEYYGLRKEHVIGKNVLEVFPDTRNNPSYDQLRRVLKGETIYFSSDKSDKNEETDYHEVYLIPVKNQKGEISAILWISHDLSKEAEAEKKLNEQSRLLQTVLDASLDGVILLKAVRNEEGKIVDYTILFNNHTTQKWNEKDLSGRNYFEEFPLARQSGLMEIFTGVLETGESADKEIFYEGPGFKNWFRITAIKLNEDELVSTAEDITKRKKAEEEVVARTFELKENKEFVEAITNTIPDVVTIVENASGKIEFANHDAMEQLGFDAEEIVTMSAEERRKLLHPDDLVPLKNYYQRFSLLSDNKENKLEYRVKNKNGDWVWLSMRGRPFKRNEKGECTHSLNICRDITSYKNAEEELKKNLVLLSYTEHLAQSGSWEYEIETGNFHWSRGMYKIFGLQPQLKISPEIYLDMAVEEDRSVSKKIVQNFRKKHEPFEEILRIKRNNEIRVFKIKGSVITDEKGEPKKIIGADIDITNIKQTEGELKESRHWREEMAKASPDSITIYDLQKKQPVYLNNCLAEWTGTPSQQLIEMGIEGRLKLVHEDDRLKLLQFNSRFAHANDRDILTLEYRIKKDDGSFMWMHNRSKVFQRDEKGVVTHILSFLQDVTEEIKLREELKRRTEYAETILDSGIDRITVFDRNYRFVGWNKRCSQVHGLAKEQVLGKTILEIFPGVKNYPDVVAAQNTALKGETVHVSTIKDEFTNGYMELFYVPLKNENGDTYAVVNIIHDVTDYVKNTQAVNELNKALESKNAELAQKNEEINHFAFVASHDMKEPLRKIQTFSDWLLQQETEQLSPKGKTLLEKMNTAVKRMDVLLEDILVLTKIHSDQHREDDVDLNKTLLRVEEEMADILRKTQTTIEAGKLLTLKGNANQVFYLFKNLISNAIKFQRPGNVPHVKITAEIVSGHELNISSAKEEYAKISFTDNGFGFDQKYAKKIFQVFQRLHGKHEFEGTGIGLAICKQIMENHEGSIDVQSEQGKGSVFSCYFPLT